MISSVIAMPFAQHVQSYIDLDVFQTFQWECLVSQLAGGSGLSFEVGLSRGVKRSGSHLQKSPTPLKTGETGSEESDKMPTR